MASLGVRCIPLLATLLACERAPLERVCPELAAGALVVTEVRGPQAEDDAGGQWIELHNATASAIALGGVSLHLVRLDGGAEAEVLVRDPDLEVAPGGYVVLGRFAPGPLPAHVDYAYGGDHEGDLYSAGALEVRSCEALLDRVIWRQLPATGTHALGVPPDAAANDDEARWCADARATPPTTYPSGTPGEANPPCS